MHQEAAQTISSLKAKAAGNLYIDVHCLSLSLVEGE